MLTRNEIRGMVVDRRFSGLPEIAHGGFLAGVMATALGAAGAEIRLMRPVPTERGLSLERPEDDLVELRDGDALVAEGVPVELALDVPLPVAPAEAEAAGRRYPGFEGHPFPDCFGCGPQRHAADGLRIFPGPVTGRRLIAATWVPPATIADDLGHVPAELVWAALDCPQLWSLIVHAPAAAPTRVVTAALAAKLEHPVLAGERHVVMAWPIGREGRRWLAGAAVIGPGGEMCATGRQVAAAASWGVPLGRERRPEEHRREERGQHDRERKR